MERVSGESSVVGARGYSRSGAVELVGGNACLWLKIRAPSRVFGESSDILVTTRSGDDFGLEVGLRIDASSISIRDTFAIYMSSPQPQPGRPWQRGRMICGCVQNKQSEHV
jgi:hypothetical protein